MLLETVIALGLLGLLGIAITSVVLVRRGSARTVQAREDWSEAVATGALPPSLHPKIATDLCIGSGTCVEVCPESDVLAVLDGQARVVNPTSCIGHGACLRACPVDAITLVLGNERRGVDIPLVDDTFQTNVPGIYIVGELGGMGLIYNAMTQAMQGMAAIAATTPPKEEGIEQVVIVGAGPAGIAAALSAMDAGLSYLCVDQEALGGTVLHYPRQKLVMTRPVTLPRYGALKLGEIRKEALLSLWQDIVEKTGLQVRERCKITGITRDGEAGPFTLAVDEGAPIRAQRVVLAMGRRGSPRKLGVPGEEKQKVAYRLLDPEQYIGKQLLVVGGGDSAVEAACSLGDAGVDVHLSYRREHFGRIKKKNRARLDASVAAGAVKLLLGTTVTEITDDTVTYAAGDETTTLANDFVLIFAGGVLPTAFLEAAGVEVKTFTGQAFAPANT